MKDGGLTKREMQVAELIAWGAAAKEIADMLTITRHTVENTTRNIYAKLRIQKATELAAWYFCHHFGIPASLSPLKRKFIAVALLVLMTPEIMHGGQHLQKDAQGGGKDRDKNQI